MHPRLYRLLEARQKLAEALRGEQRRRFPDLSRMIRLKRLDRRARGLINRFTLRTAGA